ncbi:60S ribosomal protein L18, putative [Trypanosoma cruzi]|uniref:60S ribosomal protein L18, putative n=2 Tax=Trypanosoma cruzi TaxID=5693 RepID=Q4DHK0_TRYCC|nr:60S ribosomal protein L18, putative [Trypanosoma cruzi]EAN91995.1 60S ribosomal protein L18, putative [Trypanosoma cruzi]|eukprot:XP_813846.1 60S ribosomal protein L18 [Trypanosoma cruzi strain CL Brener]
MYTKREAAHANLLQAIHTPVHAHIQSQINELTGEDKKVNNYKERIHENTGADETFPFFFFFLLKLLHFVQISEKCVGGFFFPHFFSFSMEKCVCSEFCRQFSPEEMGVDLTGVQKKKRVVRHHTYSTNPYIKLLIKLYKFLAQRTNSAFNKLVHQRLLKSRSNRAPISLSRIAVCMKRKSVWLEKGKKAPIAVIVGDVLDDVRMTRIPALRVCALRFSKSARERITGAGGECLTFDQLAMVAPTGKNTFLLRGRKSGRESVKHFGAAGVPGSHAKPFTSNRGKERQRSSARRRAFRHK